jgi:hypothetical protein
MHIQMLMGNEAIINPPQDSVHLLHWYYQLQKIKKNDLGLAKSNLMKIHTAILKLLIIYVQMTINGDNLQ